MAFADHGARSYELRCCGVHGKGHRGGAHLPGHLPELVRAIRPAVEIAKTHAPSDLVSDSIVENVRLNVNRLSVSQPLIGQYVKNGKLKVVGAVYELATGEVGLV